MEIQKNERTEYVENIIYSYLPGGGVSEGQALNLRQAKLIEAVNYSVKAGGKRLRPLLMLETARLFGNESGEIYPFMAAIEFIHTYSLVHDDLPAMDNDDYRRGKLTTHKKYGHAAGILAGDGLLNYAYEICARAIEQSSRPELAVKAFSILAECSGIYGMAGGQSVDVEMTGQPLDRDTLEFIYRLKTGALIRASMCIGAVMSGVDRDILEQIGCAANDIGMAFQIRDDILDIIADEKELGKPVGSDERNKKTTYVTLYGLEASGKMAEELSMRAVGTLKKLGDNPALFGLIEELIDRKK